MAKNFLQSALFGSAFPLRPGGDTKFSLNGPTLKVGVIFPAASVSPITDLWFLYGNATGAPPEQRYSLQGVDTSGVPDGTILGGGTPASVTFTPPANTSWNGLGRWQTLSNSYTPSARGELIAAVIDATGTPDVSNFSSWSRSVTSLLSASPLVPYAVSYNGTTWTKHSGNAPPVFAYKAGGIVYGVPWTSTLSSTVSTSGHRSVAAVTMPGESGDSWLVKGFTTHVTRLGSSAGTFVMGVWDSAGTALWTRTFDADAMANPTNAGTFESIFDSDLSMSAGVKYYIGSESTGSPVGVSGIGVTNAADREAFPGGANMAHATWNGSAWSENAVMYPLVDLKISGFVPSTGAGSGSGFASSRLVM